MRPATELSLALRNRWTTLPTTGTLRACAYPIDSVEWREEGGLKNGVCRALGVTVLGLAACVVSSAPDGSSTRAPASSASPALPASPSSPDVGTLRGPRVFDWSSSRVGGRATRGV